MRAMSRWHARWSKRAAGARLVRVPVHGSVGIGGDKKSKAGKRGADAHGAPQFVEDDESFQGPVEEVGGLHSGEEVSGRQELRPLEPRLPSPQNSGNGLREVGCSSVPCEVRESVVSESEESTCVVEVDGG